MNCQQYYNEGIAFKEAGEFEKSAEYHLKVIEIKPDINMPEAWHNAGAALLRVKKPAEAEPYLLKAVELYDAASQAVPGKQAYYLYWKAAVYSLLRNKGAMLETLNQCFETDDSYAREAAFEEDFSHYAEDEDFKNLVEPIVKAIEVLLFRGESLSQADVSEDDLLLRKNFIEILEKDGWRKDSFFTDCFEESNFSVSPQACYEYCENKDFCFRLSLHLDTKLVFLEIFDREDHSDIMQFRLYYDQNDMQTQMPKSLEIISKYKDSFESENLPEMIKEIVPTCRLQMQNLDGTRVNIG